MVAQYRDTSDDPGAIVTLGEIDTRTAPWMAKLFKLGAAAGVLSSNTADSPFGVAFDYFKIEQSSAQMPTKAATLAALDAAGFDVLAIEPYSVQPDLQDAFLYSGKYDAARYFDPLIRANISSFANLIDAAELASGLAMLRTDIDSGQIHSYIQTAEHPDGDYAFLQLQART